MVKTPKRCLSCVKRPSFAPRGQSALYCSLHKQNGMINVDKVNSICQLCDTRSSYGYPDTQATRCLQHRLDGMARVERKKCVVCRVKWAGWGVGKSKTHCIGCKTGDMTSIHKLRMCRGCKTKRAAYSSPTDKSATHCRSCKEDGMLPTVSRCIVCHQKRVTFAHEGGKPSHCGDCRQSGMIDVTHRRCACGKCMPSFGLPTTTRRTHCRECATGGMVDVRSPKCEFPGCGVRRDKGRGLKFCANHDTERRRQTRVRENKVANFIRESDLPPWTSWDKQIRGVEKDVCGKYRPDFVWEMPGHVVVLEVDEQQHAYPGYSCEDKRMLDIWNSYGGMPVVMIRMNPDAFKLEGTTRKVSWERRLQLLKDTLKKHLACPGQHLFAVHRLFYDNPSTELVASTVVSGMDTGNFTESPL